MPYFSQADIVEQRRRDREDQERADAFDLGAESCEHGLSASLCAGPQHYPADRDERWTTPELMAATSSQYHARGESCPWDCSRCPGNAEPQELPIAELRVAATDEWLVTLYPGENIAQLARQIAADRGRAVKVVRL